MTVVAAAGATAARPFPSGNAQAEVIRFQLAVYYPARPATEPMTALRALVARDWKKLSLVTGELPLAPAGMVVNARLENEVQKKYTPPNLAALKLFGRGLSAAQTSALQGSQQALILNFTHPKVHALSGLRNAYGLAEQVARKTGGLLWDEETREVFTPESWHQRRLAKWTANVPEISANTTIHSYKNGELVRAISLGMAKFGLPDIVVDQFAWSSSRSVATLMNVVGQALAEGALVGVGGQFDVDVRKIAHEEMREDTLKWLKPNAQKVGKLILVKADPDKGDPPNRLAAISFARYRGPDVHARQTAMLASMFGSTDSIKSISHNGQLEKASELARKKLATMASEFASGLPVGEYIQVKAPFATAAGDVEYMWVEIKKWKGNDIEGLLKNEPYDVPTLRSGQLVKVRLDQVFDYMRSFPDGRQAGNTTGPIIQQMQGTTRN